MAAKGGRIDFMFLGPPLTRPLDPLLESSEVCSHFFGEMSVSGNVINIQIMWETCDTTKANTTWGTMTFVSRNYNSQNSLLVDTFKSFQIHYKSYRNNCPERFVQCRNDESLERQVKYYGWFADPNLKLSIESNHAEGGHHYWNGDFMFSIR